MMRLAQDLQVQLYLNLATDRTFLFRDGQVSIETRVDGTDRRSRGPRRARCLRRDRRFVPRYSELAYVAPALRGPAPARPAVRRVTAQAHGPLDGRGRRLLGTRRQAQRRGTSRRADPRGRGYREEHARFFRKECVGCGSNYALNLAWRPSTYVEDVLWRLGKASALRTRGRRMRSSAPLYDLLAPTYDEHFAVPTAGRTTTWPGRSSAHALPDPPAVVVDVGCGVGRWTERLLDAGYTADRDRAGAGDGRPRGARLAGRADPVRPCCGQPGGGRRARGPGRWTSCWRWAPCSTPTTRPRDRRRGRGGCVLVASLARARRHPAGTRARAPRRGQGGRGTGAAEHAARGLAGGRRRGGPPPVGLGRPCDRPYAEAGLEVDSRRRVCWWAPRRTAGTGCSAGWTTDFPGALAAERRLAARARPGRPGQAAAHRGSSRSSSSDVEHGPEHPLGLADAELRGHRQRQRL